MVRCVIKKNDRQNDEKLAKQNREKEYLKEKHYQAKLKVKQTEEKVISSHIDNAEKKKFNSCVIEIQLDYIHYSEKK